MLDRNALEDASVDISSEVQARAKGITLRNFLKLLLEQGPFKSKMRFVVEDEVLKITTPEKANR